MGDGRTEFAFTLSTFGRPWDWWFGVCQESVRDGRFQRGPGDVIVEVLDADAPADDGQLRALQAENAGLAHELEELRARNEFLRLQVESSREAVTAGDGEERRARQERSLEELEELQKSYAELLDRLHAEIDELLGADE